MCWCEVGSRSTSECEAVDEEETEDDNDAGENTPPEPLVHRGLDMLLTFHEILHGEV